MSLHDDFRDSMRLDREDFDDKHDLGLRGPTPLNPPPRADGACRCHDHGGDGCYSCMFDGNHERRRVRAIERGKRPDPPWHSGRGEESRPCRKCAPLERAEFDRIWPSNSGAP